jgi:hypothetical protein
LNKGDFVYLHNLVAKRGPAKKFEYKYQCPYIVLKRISPLIYVLQVEQGKSVAVHVNRLKRAHESPKCNQNKVEPEENKGEKKLIRKNKLRQNEIRNDFRDEEEEITPSRLPGEGEYEDRDIGDHIGNEDSSPEDRKHSEWVPETQYLRRKMFRETSKSLGSSSDIPYTLRPRSTRTQVNRDTSDLDTVSTDITENRETTSGNNLEHITVDVSPPRIHPYNLIHYLLLQYYHSNHRPVIERN